MTPGDHFGRRRSPAGRGESLLEGPCGRACHANNASKGTRGGRAGARRRKASPSIATLFTACSTPNPATLVRSRLPLHLSTTLVSSAAGQTCLKCTSCFSAGHLWPCKPHRRVPLQRPHYYSLTPVRPPASEVGAAIFHYTSGITKPAPVVSFKGSMFIANPATNVVICGRYAGASLVGGAGCKGRRPAEREGPSVRKGGLLHGVMCTSIPGHLAAALPDRADQIIYFPKPRDDGAKSGLNKCDMRPCGVRFCALSVLSQAWVVPLGAPG